MVEHLDKEELIVDDESVYIELLREFKHHLENIEDECGDSIRLYRKTCEMLYSKEQKELKVKLASARIKLELMTKEKGLLEHRNIELSNEVFRLSELLKLK